MRDEALAGGLRQEACPKEELGGPPWHHVRPDSNLPRDTHEKCGPARTGSFLQFAPVILLGVKRRILVALGVIMC